MIPDWIDALCAVWEISDARFGTVKSYKLIDGADFPSSIEAAELDLQPIALTVPAFKMRPEYSLGGHRIGYYTGLTEIHVAPDADKSRIPQLMTWYERILRAAAAKMKLGNTVAYFVIDPTDGIELDILQYGAENPHWGFLVHWEVQEHLTLTVSA